MSSEKFQYFTHDKIRKPFTSGDFVTTLIFVDKPNEYKGNKHYKVLGLVKKGTEWIEKLKKLIDELMPIAHKHYEAECLKTYTGKSLAKIKKDGLAIHGNPIQVYYDKETGEETDSYNIQFKVPDVTKKGNGRVKSNKPKIVDKKAKPMKAEDIETPANVSIAYRVQFIPVEGTLYCTLKLLGVQYLGQPENDSYEFSSRDSEEDYNDEDYEDENYCFTDKGGSDEETPEDF